MAAVRATSVEVARIGWPSGLNGGIAAGKMTAQEFSSIESGVGSFIDDLQVQARRGGRAVPFWHYTILRNRLFTSLLEEQRLPELPVDSDERAIAIALVLLGRTVTVLGDGVWINPLDSARPKRKFIAELTAFVRRQLGPSEPWSRAHQIVVAALLGYKGFEVPSIYSSWRRAAVHVTEVIARCTAMARINWLCQLDEFLKSFNEHPVLVGERDGVAGVERVIRRMVHRVLDGPPCDHWKIRPGLPDPGTVQVKVDLKRGVFTNLLGDLQAQIEHTRKAELEGTAARLDRVLEDLRGQVTSEAFLENYERAFVSCRRVHSLQSWNPSTTSAPVIEPPEKGGSKPAENVVLADLWVFLIRAFSGVASWLDYVISAADTTNIGVLNSNAIFKHWETYAQPFSRSLLFHSLNARSEVLRWAFVVDWQCHVCQRPRSTFCLDLPEDVQRCGFEPGPESMPFLLHRYVRRDQIGKGLDYAPVKVWLCPGKHFIQCPSGSGEPGKPPPSEEKKVCVVFPLRLERCPWGNCNTPHSARSADVLVVADYLRLMR